MYNQILYLCIFFHAYVNKSICFSRLCTWQTFALQDNVLSILFVFQNSIFFRKHEIVGLADFVISPLNKNEKKQENPG
jgi:hypothetical protein